MAIIEIEVKDEEVGLSLDEVTVGDLTRAIVALIGVADKEAGTDLITHLYKSRKEKKEDDESLS